MRCGGRSDRSTRSDPDSNNWHNFSILDLALDILYSPCVSRPEYRQLKQHSNYTYSMYYQESMINNYFIIMILMVYDWCTQTYMYM